jgi:hypothetical protein
MLTQIIDTASNLDILWDFNNVGTNRNIYDQCKRNIIATAYDVFIYYPEYSRHYVGYVFFIKDFQYDIVLQSAFGMTYYNTSKEAYSVANKLFK